MSFNHTVVKWHSVEFIYINESSFATVFTPITVKWEKVKEKLESCVKTNPHYNSNDIVRCVCQENNWSWKPDISDDGPDIIIFAEF